MKIKILNHPTIHIFSPNVHRGLVRRNSVSVVVVRVYLGASLIFHEMIEALSL